MAEKSMGFCQVKRRSAVPGFAFGMRYPALLVVLAIDENAHDEKAGAGHFEAVNAALAERLRGSAPPQGVLIPDVAPADGFLASLLHGLAVLQAMAGLPVYESGRTVGRQPGEAALALPVLAEGFKETAFALDWLLAIFNRPSGMGTSAENGNPAGMENLPEVLARLGVRVTAAFNTPRFLRAAYDRGVQAMTAAGDVIQYGQGVHARRMLSSFTDETTHLAAMLAGNKRWAADVMRQAGIPVPRHELVVSAQEAVDLAGKLGYPVVVKPADKARGQGVFPGLMNADEVCAAYESASALTANVLVEKHVEGRDYRLYVFNGELIWAVERVPAGVVGDGVHTIEELIEIENENPDRGDHVWTALKRLETDAETIRVLSSLDMGVASVPKPGEFVPLRRKANISAGGTPVAVFDKIHPDNRLLAIRAAEALRLDLAGVDLLMPDISRSWRETGAAVCEINGQPMLSNTAPHLYSEILSKLIPGDGRIPIAVFLGAAKGVVAEITARLRESGKTVGWADASGVYVNDDFISRADVGAYAASQMLVTHPKVEAILLNLHDESVLKTGVGFDRYDILVFAGKKMPVAGLGDQGALYLLNKMLWLLLPGCDGKFISVKDADIHPLAGQPWLESGVGHVPMPGSGLVDEVVKQLFLAVKRHGARS